MTGDTMDKDIKYGRLTLPTDSDIIRETKNLMKQWGADALRDCDGTDFPEELKNTGAKVYATYYTTRKDNDWAKTHPEEIQQCYIMSAFQTATGKSLEIELMKGFSRDLLKPNTHDDITRWWEVIDRTTGEIVSPEVWHYNEEKDLCILMECEPWHEYTVSFLAYLIWDPVHMYNSVINGWKGEPQQTFDVRQGATQEWSKKRLRRFLIEKPYVDVVRFTTFFHQFTLIFDELKREKYVDWFGYSASVCPLILKQFEEEAGYPFRPEFIIDQGYYNNQYRNPSKEYLDFMAFQRREVNALVKELTDIVHEFDKEAMMFLGDHWIGTEPFLEEFASSGVDAVVGSVGNGSTLRLISDIPKIQYTEGRLLPYFFPDTFCPGGNPLKEARENWVTARRAFLRKPVDRIGYGGYLKLTLDFPEFLDYVETTTNEFRALYKNISKAKPFCSTRVAVLNAWGKMRSWGAHMVHHALYQKENKAYSGVIEILSGSAHDVDFLSFEDIKENPDILERYDTVINVGGGETAHSGGAYWADSVISTSLKAFVHKGGGFIGIGEPSAYQHSGRYFQLASVLGVEKETGFTLGYDKYNWNENLSHFIVADKEGSLDFGQGGRNVYALEGTEVVIAVDREIKLAVNSFGKGHSVYISGLPYSLKNARLLHRALLWASGKQDDLKRWHSTNVHVEIHAYPATKKYCAVNNTSKPQETILFLGDGSKKQISLNGNEIIWEKI